MTVAAGTVVQSRVGAVRDRFNVGLAVAFIVIAFVGFAPGYRVPLLRGTLDVPPILHLHAAIFYGWLVFFLVQARLVAAGEVRRHRELGVAGVSLATAMLFVGLGAALVTLKHAEAAGFGDAARRFTIVSVSGILLFAGLVAAAIAMVKKPDVHKRLMIVATVSILQAAVGRMFLFFLAPPRLPGATGPVSPPPVAVSVLPGLLVDLLIVAAMVHDRRTTGRVHRVYWITGALLVAVQVLRVPLSTTSAWTQVAHWLTTVLT